MTYGQLIDAVVSEAERIGVTLDTISFERHRRAIDGIAFTFSEGDNHARHIVSDRERQTGEAGDLAEWVCYSASSHLSSLASVQ